MAITSSIVVLYKNIPFDPEYKNTTIFKYKNGNAGTVNNTQERYFAVNSRIIARMTDVQWVRENKNQVKVPYVADRLYNCNYIAFKNHRTGTDKWFYAFVDSVDYVNESTSLINFTIDVMQTWQFDFTPLTSFVEREHTETDEPGDNTVVENLELGDYFNFGPYINRYSIEYLPDPEREAYPEGYPRLSDRYIGIAATFFYQSDEQGIVLIEPDNVYDVLGSTGPGGTLLDLTSSGIFNTLAFAFYPKDTLIGRQLALDYLADAGSKIDGVVSVFEIPVPMVTPSGVYNYASPYKAVGTLEPRKMYFAVHKELTALRGEGGTVYTPKNKKLLTYPYNYLYVTNNQGMAVAMPYEYFKPFDLTSSDLPPFTTEANPDDYCFFQYTGDITPNPSVYAIPLNYKIDTLTPGTFRLNTDQKITLTGFPQCTWSGDAYKAWLAQNSSSMNLQVGSAFLNIVTSTAAGAVVGGGIPGAIAGAAAGVVSLGATIANTLVQKNQAELRPDQAKGSGTNTSLAACGLLDFSYWNRHIKLETAEIIDSYFTMFGYAVKKAKTPIWRDSGYRRKMFNYTKTLGCIIGGDGIPAEAEKKICSIFDNGVTFWWDPSDIGDYSGDNSPYTP